MPVDRAKIEQLEKELEEARKELWKEDAKRYQVLVREISGDEQRRIMEELTDRNERILFGLEEEEAPRKRAGSAGGERRGNMSNLRQIRFNQEGTGASYDQNA